MIPLINRDNSCCFSGYRPEKLPWGLNEDDRRCIKLKETILSITEKTHLSGITHFICGMARGSDTYFCEAVIVLRAKHPIITLEAAIPCEGQAAKWREEERHRYDDLVSKCDHVTFVSHLYTKSCMQQRNRYMVDNSSVLIAVHDGKRGGTNYTKKYAERRGLEIIEIEP